MTFKYKESLENSQAFIYFKKIVEPELLRHQPQTHYFLLGYFSFWLFLSTEKILINSLKHMPTLTHNFYDNICASPYALTFFSFEFASLHSLFSLISPSQYLLYIAQIWLCFCPYLHVYTDVYMHVNIQIYGVIFSLFTKMELYYKYILVSCFFAQTIPHGNSPQCTHVALLNDGILCHGLIATYLAISYQWALPLSLALGYCTLVCSAHPCTRVLPCRGLF